MSLAGLLTIVDDDPQLHDVVSRARSRLGSRARFAARRGRGRARLTTAGRRRPGRAADAAAGAGGRAGPWRPRGRSRVRARGHGHGQGGRRPGGRARFLSPAGQRGLLPRLGDPAPRAAIAAIGHRGAADRRATPARPPGGRRRAERTAGGSGDAGPEPAAADRGRPRRPRAGHLQVGQACELDDLLVRLVEIGYSRVDLVASRGEIAVRGGIVDVFPPTEEHPLRIEFFGDTIEEIRYFKVADQRSIGPAEHGLWAPPCRELLLTPAVRQRAKELADTHPALSDILGKLAEGIAVEGMEAFAPVLADRMELLVDYVPAGGIVLTCDPERVRTRAEELVRTSQEFLEASWVNAAAGGEAPVDLGAAAFQPIARIRAAAAALGLPWWTIAPFGVTDSEADEPGRRAAARPTQAERTRGEPSSVPYKRLRRTCLPRRRGPHGHRRARLARGGLAGRTGHRGPRAGPAPGRDASRRGDRRPLDRSCRSARAQRPVRDDRADPEWLPLAGGQAGPADRERPSRASGRAADDQGHAADAEQAARRRRPAAAEVRRLRGARAARRRPVRGDDIAGPRRAPPGSTW